MTEGRGNAGAVESVENQRQVSHAFHRPLEISQKARDSHIPTAGLAAMEKWKTKTRFSNFPTAARNDNSCSLSEGQKTRKEVGRCAVSSFPIRSPYGRTEPVSCSLFDWKMLRRLTWLKMKNPDDSQAAGRDEPFKARAAA